MTPSSSLLFTLSALILFTACVTASPPQPSDGSKVDVTFDGRSLMLNGQRELFLSGGLHYPRIPDQDWDGVFANAKALGLNMIQTYVFWNVHEHVRGNLTWSGQADLSRFLTLAQKHDLWVSLRIGPYICGEWTSGGIPLWMRQSGAACYRCADPTWESEMGRFVGEVIKEVRPLLAPNGGPVVLLQIENEYHGDQTYLDWAVSMANNLTAGVEVPWMLCHDRAQCGQVNKDLGADAALCTINGFWMDVYDKDPGQPSPAWASLMRSDSSSRHPFMWTEDQGWFDGWGTAQRVRFSPNEIYGISRALAYGLASHNFYMLSGGNNYGRTAGGVVVTAYAPDTIIDYLLLRHEGKFQFFERFFGFVNSVKEVLLSHPVASAQTFSGDSTGLEYHEYGSLALLSNYGNPGPETVSLGGHTYTISNGTVLWVNSTTGQVLFDTAEGPPDVLGGESTTGVVASSSGAVWQYYKEPIGFGTRGPTTATNAAATRMIDLTENDSDYAWYNTTVTDVADGSSVDVSMTGGAYGYPYINGVRLVAAGDGTFVVPQEAVRETDTGSSELAVLACAMGMPNVGKPVNPSYEKGLQQVKVDGKAVPGPWRASWWLSGEAKDIPTPGHSDRVTWKTVTPDVEANATATWFRTFVDLPPGAPVPVAGQGQPNQTAFALDLSTMSKGAAYVNGFNIGRYFLLPGKCDGPCGFEKDGYCYLPWREGACGAPTQHLYHIPAQVLKPTNNLIALFEEDLPLASRGGKRSVEGVELVVLKKHPSLD